MMKKLLATVVSLCMLAVLIPFTPVNAATVPWSPDIEVKGTAQIGQTITVPKDTEELYYQLDLKAGQAVYFYQNPDTEMKADVSVYGNYSSKRDGDLYDENYYAVKDETVFVRLTNDDDGDYDDDVTDSNAYVTIQAGQTFNKTVTKEDGRGNNTYFYKPSVTGEYTFRLSSSDDEASPHMRISAIKGGSRCELKEKDRKETYAFGSMEATVVLQAGNQYIINVEPYDSSYAPYTLSLVSAPAQPQTSVKVAKTKIKSVVSKKAKTAVVTWKKAKGATGYQVTYSEKKNFKKAKSVTVSAKKTKATLKKLTKGKKYYVKVRTLKKVNGKTYSSAYSRTLKVKVK